MDIDYARVSRLILSGQSIEIEPGSLTECPGELLRWYGSAEPILIFRTLDGQRAVLQAHSIVGFGLVDAPAVDVDAVAAA